MYSEIPDIYYMETDHNGVECVDMVHVGDNLETVEDVAALAEEFPDVIYFVFEKLPDTETEEWD